jgi:hypothetical protein
LYTDAQRRTNLRWAKKNREKILAYREKYHQKLKQTVFSHYGRGKIQCVKCGFNDIRALSIDHINGSGTEHRNTNKYSGGIKFYRWLKKNNYPDGFQVLCMNCQFIKRVENKEYGN